jgi:F-type H+-transporting ATPase subunit b
MLFAAMLAAAPKAAESTNNFLIPNGTIIIEVVIFLVLLWILARKFPLPQINRAVETRQTTIRQQFEDAEKAKDEAEKAKQEYTEALAETRREISRLREEANDEKAQIIREARETARAEAEAVAEQERARLATERQQVLLSLRNEIGDLAFTLAEKIVVDSLRDKERQKRLVDSFIAGVGTTVRVQAEAGAEVSS